MPTHSIFPRQGRDLRSVCEFNAEFAYLLIGHGRFPADILIFSFSFGNHDPFPLALQNQCSLKLGNSRDNMELKLLEGIAFSRSAVASEFKLFLVECDRDSLFFRVVMMESRS